MIWIVSAVLNALRGRKSLPGKNLWNGKRFLFTPLTAFNDFLHLIIAVLAIIFEFYCNSESDFRCASPRSAWHNW